MSTQPDGSCIPFSEVEQLREARDILRQESQALADVARRLDASFCAAVNLLARCTGAVVVTGMGKAGLIGQKITATLSSTGTRALFLHPAEAVHGDLGCVGSGDVALALSNSGETEELCRLIPLLKRLAVPILAITARETSTLGREADVTITLGHLREAGQFGLAPTTSTTAMLALGDALALVTGRTRGFTRQQFALYHPAGTLGQKLRRVAELMRDQSQLRLAPQTVTIREVCAMTGARARRTGAVILVDSDGRLAGLFTDSDLVRLLESRREHQLDRPVAEVMTVNPLTIGPDAPLADAVDLLSRHHISELPVVDADCRPVGLIDITDVIALLPEQTLD